MGHVHSVSTNEETRAANDPMVFTTTVKAPSRAFSWLKEPLSHVRHYVLRLYSKQAPKHGK